jgi:predicted nucleic-acid-binding Zn-ribbon protein
MKIVKIIHQHRRDFTAEIKCEFCGYTRTLEGGYDDRNYHDNVLPEIKCKKCGESTISGGGTIEKRDTKYPDWMQI